MARFVAVADDADIFLSESNLNSNREIVKKFQKLVKHKNGRDILETAHISLKAVGPTRIQENIKRLIAQKILYMLGSGLNMSDESEEYWSWKIGSFGSIWFDVPAKEFGFEGIRVAFYSKHNSREWKYPKDYLLAIYCE
jgi:hypothetical protein